jgi:hypothetical protein
MKKDGEQKILVSARIKLKILEKIEMLANQDDRSRNFIINKLLEEILNHLEKKHGEIVVKQSILEKNRNRRKRGSAKRSSKSD